jgi:hypothetical protein
MIFSLPYVLKKLVVIRFHYVVFILKAFERFNGVLPKDVRFNKAISLPLVGESKTLELGQAQSPQHP